MEETTPRPLHGYFFLGGGGGRRLLLHPSLRAPGHLAHDCKPHHVNFDTSVTSSVLIIIQMLFFLNVLARGLALSNHCRVPRLTLQFDILLKFNS